eukprot:3293437-Rhodomonas_salina.3
MLLPGVDPRAQLQRFTRRQSPGMLQNRLRETKSSVPAVKGMWFVSVISSVSAIWPDRRSAMPSTDSAHGTMTPSTDRADGGTAGAVSAPYHHAYTTGRDVGSVPCDRRVGVSADGAATGCPVLIERKLVPEDPTGEWAEGFMVRGMSLRAC